MWSMSSAATSSTPAGRRPAGARPGTSRTKPSRARSSPTVPTATIRPAAMIPIVAEPFDQVELVAGEEHRDAAVGSLPQHAAQRRRRPSGRARRTARRAPAPRGRAPARRRSARAAGCPATASAPRRRPLGDAEPLGPALRPSAEPRRRQPVQPGEVAQLLANLHLRVEAALFGHVPMRRAARRRSGEPSQRTSPASAASTPSTIRIASSCRPRCCRRTRTPRLAEPQRSRPRVPAGIRIASRSPLCPARERPYWSVKPLSPSFDPRLSEVAACVGGALEA